MSVQSSDIAGAWRSSPVSSVRPQDLVLVSDFDGTLADIVPEPTQATPLPDSLHALRRLVP
ncbi:MAG TPA: trehalose-phosphatase, partial [Candidatus Dormibacteraeota bacterium]